MSPLTRFLPTGAWTRALLAPALVFIATALDRNYETDFWHHLARGRAMVERGGLVDQDLFTYTVPGHAFQDTNWLTQLFYYALHSLGGLSLVQFVNSLTLAVMMGLLVALCWRRSRSLLLSGGLGVCVFIGLLQLLIIRPQTFSLLLFVGLYAVLELADRRRWLLLVPPAIMALWVNLHGGFPIGLILIGCYFLAAAWEAWHTAPTPDPASTPARSSLFGSLVPVWRDTRCRALALCLAVSVLATLANPYGWKVYLYVRTTSIAASSRHIDEWVPPGLNLMVGRVWVLSMLLLLVLFTLPRRRPTTREVCLLLCFLPLACGSVRMVSWWLLITAPIAAGLIADNLPRQLLDRAENEQPSWGAAGFFALLVLGIVLCIPGLERINPVLNSVRSPHRDEYDLQAVADHLLETDGQRQGTRRVFSRFEWGEYLGWSLAPAGYTVFMDGRIEIFPDDVWTRYSAVTIARADWEKILDDYQVDALLLDTSYHADLLRQVEQSPHWEGPVKEVGKAVLFLRKPDAAVRAPYPGPLQPVE
jgi:hypothetical protein